MSHTEHELGEKQGFSCVRALGSYLSSVSLICVCLLETWLGACMTPMDYSEVVS